MQTRIQLSSYDSTKRLRLEIDGAKTVGIRFILIQYLNEEKPEKGVNTIHAESGKVDPEKENSPIEAEAITLSRAMEACHQWLYYSDPVQLISDCQGLLGLMEKNLDDVDNKKLQKILTGDSFELQLGISTYQWRRKQNM